MRAKKPTELEGTFTLPAHLEFRCFPVECKFTAEWQPPEPQLHQDEGYWEPETVCLFCDTSKSIISINHEGGWYKENLDEIHEAIDEYCNLQAQNDEPNIQGDE